MDDKTRLLLFDIAGFLTLLKKGLQPSPHIEAERLLNKIGDLIAHSEEAE